MPNPLLPRSQPFRRITPHFSDFMKAIFLLSLSAAVALGGDFTPIAQPTTPSHGWYTKSVSAGVGWRSFGDLSFRGGTRSQGVTINPLVGDNSLTYPTIGTTDNVGDRRYNNGYVNQDGSTSSSGDTWNWGYDNPSQIQGDSLDYSATGYRTDFSQSSSFQTPGRTSDDLEGFAPQFDAIFAPPSNSRLPFDGILVSLAFFSDDSSGKFSNYQVNQASSDYRLDITDRYNLGGITPPQAPYSGNATGPGPLISNLPSDRQQVDTLLNTSTADISNSVSTSLSLDSFSLAVGPTKSGSFSSKWHWQASGGMTLNIFKWRARQTETLNARIQNGSSSRSSQLASWQDKKSGTEFRVGAYLKGEVIRDLPQDWFIKGYLQGEIADSVKMSIGPSEYKLDPQGWSFGLSLGKSF